jgi:hypothetical protein
MCSPSAILPDASSHQSNIRKIVCLLKNYRGLPSLMVAYVITGLDVSHTVRLKLVEQFGPFLGRIAQSYVAFY